MQFWEQKWPLNIRVVLAAEQFENRDILNIFDYAESQEKWWLVIID